MKRKLFKSFLTLCALLVVLLLAGPSSPARAQAPDDGFNPGANDTATALATQTDIAGTNVWTTHGPVSETVRALAIAPSNPNTLYAGASYLGVFKSVNHGTDWLATANFVVGGPLNALAVDPTDPNIVYAGAFATGAVYESTDGGANWSDVLPTMDVYAVVIDPTNPNTLYAAAGLFPMISGAKLAKSTNGGTGWSAADTGLPDYVSSLALDPTNPNTLYAGTSGGLYKTTNGGELWSVVSPGMTSINCIVVDPTNPLTVYVCTSGSGVSKSTNGGTVWSPINNNLTSTAVRSVAIDPTNPNTLYAGTYDAGVFQTTTGGASWSAMNSGLTNTSVSALVFDPTPPKTLYAGTDGGVFDIELGSYAAPTLTSGSPMSALAGGPAYTLTVTGTNFGIGSIVRWNGTDRATTYQGSTQLMASIPASDIATPGVAYITVFNPSPGGGTSNPLPFYITQTGAGITDSNTASGTNPSATTGGSNGVTANATGNGTVTVGIYNSNPGGTPSFSSSGAYMDVHVASGNTFTSLMIVDCNLNGGTQVYWWNGTTWALASNQSYNSSTHCVTITVNNSTSPSLSQLTGTPFGAAGGLKLFLPLILR